MRSVSFRVDGRPQQRGSKRAIPRKNGGPALMVDANKKSGPWMDAVSFRARVAMESAPNGDVLIEGPLVMWATFYFKRPKAHFKKSGLRDDAPLYHSGTPDSDKLLRAIGDAMTGVVYHDDKQLAEVHVQKRYTDGAEGVQISVQQVTPNGPVGRE
jgi:Holliday junction resolvase RusA-like endonuclease